MEHISFETEDGISIAGSWSAPEGAKVSVLLLHMWPSTKESWTQFQALLSERKIASLAIDLRGHGKSSGEQKQDAGDMRFDVDASLRWLDSQGIKAHGIAGASIGANLALRAMADHSDLIAGILLSPGIDYHGVTTLDAVERLSDAQSLYCVASDGDDNESADAVRTLIERAPIEDKSQELFSNAGHGTNMFDTHPDFMVSCANWFSDILNDL